MSVQLWSGDCSLVKGKGHIQGYLSLTAGRMEFMGRSRGLFGIVGSTYESIWDVPTVSITAVRLGEGGWRSGIVLVEYGRTVVRFQFDPGAVLNAVTSISYALDVSRRLGDEDRFSLRKAVQEYQSETARIA